MPYDRNSDLPDSVKNVLPAAAQTIWRSAFNSAEEQYDSEETAFRIAWSAVQKAGYQKGSDGQWHQRRDHSMRLIDGGWLAVFRTGQHTDMHGFTRQWTGEDLSSIVRNYASKEHEAPLVIGHPRLDDPAYGWCKDVRANGSLLEVQVHQVVPQFAALVEQGSYKKRSIALDGDGAGGWRLRHVGFLGATPPAVAGLPDLVKPFATQPVGTFVLDLEDPMPAQTAHHPPIETGVIAKALRAMRDFMLSIGGPEWGDRILTQQEEDTLIAGVPAGGMPALQGRPQEGSNATDGQGEGATEMSTPPQSVTLAVQQAEERLREEFATKEKAAADRIATLEAENRRQVIQQRLKDLKRQGQITPAMEKLGLLAFCEQLASQPGTTISFAGADGSQQSTPLAQWFDRFLALLPKSVELAEVVDPLDDTGRIQKPTQAIMARAEQRAKEKNITTGAALLEIGQEDPEGYSAYVAERRQNGRA
jgi:cation transport regulator ChaB